MKNIYDDDQIMSPDIMDKIAREYASQKITKQNQLDKTITSKLQNNLALLEYINSYQKNTPANLQKCLIKTYALIKDEKQNPINTNQLSTDFDNAKSYNKPLSVQSAIQTCLTNSLEIIQYIANNYKHIISDNEYKAIKVCIECVLEINK